MNLYNPTFLIVDDHPMILNSYLRLLKEKFVESQFYTSENIEKAIGFIDDCKSIDVLIVDFNLTKQINSENSIVDGAGLAFYAQNKFPKMKTIVITGHEEALILYGIHKKVKPDGFLVKGDVTDELLIDTIRKCLVGHNCYSDGVTNVLNIVAKRELMQQDQYVEILMLLDKGYKVQEICDIVYKSSSTVQRMLSTLKKEFDVNDLSELLRQVKMQGYI